MPVTTNAKTPNQKKLVAAFADRFDDPDTEVNFDGLKVNVADKETGDLESFGNYAAFKRHIESEEAEAAPEPAPAEAPAAQPTPTRPEPDGDADDDFEDFDDFEDDEAIEAQPEPAQPETVEPEPGEDDFDQEAFDTEAVEAAQEEAADAEAAATEDEEGEPEPEAEEEDDEVEALADAIAAAMEEGGDEDEDDEAEQKEVEKKAEKAKKETQKRETKRTGKKKDKADDELDKLIADMAKTVIAERKGEIAKNEARWRKGEQVDRIDEIAARYKQAGNEDMSSRAKLLNFATSAVEDTVRAQGIIDGVSRLNQTELAFTKKAYTTFAKFNGGVQGTFALKDQLDENGNPLEDTDGEPIIKQIGEIALNKAYHLADFMTETNRDRLLSFAWAYSEGTCRGLYNLLKEKNATKYTQRVDDVLDAFYENQIEVEDEAGATVKINMPDKDARDFLKKSGAKVDTQVKSIKVDAALYEGGWRDTVLHASKVWSWLGNEVHPEQGTIRNTVLLERLLGFFSPAEYGFSNLVQMFVESGDMTKEQAEKFLEEHQDFDPAELEA